MTGGYGCIGSWVAKQLVDAGEEVWIYDLKEDTHRLDLILEPEQRSSVHFVPGDVADRRRCVGVGGSDDSPPAPGGLAGYTCRANPILGATVNVIGTLAVFGAALSFRTRCGGSSAPARRQSRKPSRG
jgi:nucleoside-diphosphate-sugar epimerase